ncbi:MAG: hypothetical protein G8237_09605 [Magnetococcales bacterium]|nr:hypothetical protein [Magnetococcales bacterium]
MKEHPILFSGPMVRAILEGRKTQTRRVIKPQPSFNSLEPGSVKWKDRCFIEWSDKETPAAQLATFCPYGKPGDRLWVRETFAIVPRTAYVRSVGVQQILRPDDYHDAAIFRASFDRAIGKVWRPSIHMPRWASRITLEITDIRVERLQDISDPDAKAEGVMLPDRTCTMYHGIWRDEFQRLWDSINAKRGHGWNVNPWVWVIEFRRVTP